jgi:hypothetical protein
VSGAAEGNSRKERAREFIGKRASTAGERLL